jgi:hypothetical protein
MNGHAVVSIATTDYLPMCLTMLGSVARNHPEVALICYLIDCDEPPASVALLPGGEGDEGPGGSRVQLVGRRAFENDGLAQARDYFDVFELACASKFAALRHALEVEGYAGVVYLDCDFFCFAPFSGVFDQLKEKAVLVTPHCLGPLELGQGPTDDYALLTVGWMNAGMIAASQAALTLGIIGWLEARVLHYGFNWPSIGLFVDQSWVSALPSVFPESVGMILDPGVNAGHWNAADRALRAEGNVLLAGSSSLKLFHFSGFDREVPERLTRFAHRQPPEASQPALQIALRSYAAARSQQDGRIVPCQDLVALQVLPIKKRVSNYAKTRGAGSLCDRMWQELAKQEAETGLPETKATLATTKAALKENKATLTSLKTQLATAQHQLRYHAANPARALGLWWKQLRNKP